MAANIEQEEHDLPGPVMPTPGLLNCSNLEINKSMANTGKVLNMVALEERNSSSQIMNAARNFNGLLLYHDSEEDKAIELWKETVADDPCNINALQDLATAYSRLTNHQEAESYTAKCEKAINDAMPDDRKMIFARCQMEQAFAFCYDPISKSVDKLQHRKQKLKFFDNAFLIAGNLLEREEFQKEKRDLLLYRGQANRSLFWTFILDDQSEMHDKYFQKAVHDLQQCLRLSTDKDAYRTLVLLLLATVFKESFGHKERYKDIWEDPTGYYEEGLGIDADAVEILVGFGFYCYNTDKLHDAGQLLDKAIEVVENMPQSNPSRDAWPEAWCYRALVWIKESRILPPQDSFYILTKAKEYSERALKNTCCNLHLTSVAEVYNLLAKNKLTSSGEANVLMGKAHQLFSKALCFKSDRHLTVTVYLKWGRCLSDDTDLHLRCAIECYKIAIDTTIDHQGSFLRVLSKELLSVMLTNYKAQKKPILLLEEVAFWCVYIANRFASLLEYLPFKKLKWKFAFEILEVMEFIVQHITELTSNPKDLSNGMLMTTINDMKDWKWHKAAKRFQALSSENTNIMNNLPTATRCTYRRPQADDEPTSRNKALHEEFTYDFCIINDEDPDIDGWVKYSLLTGLESKLFSSGLKGYYNKRMKLGQFSYRMWENVIKESAHVLIVLSHDLDESLQTEVAKIANDKGVILLKKQTEVPLKLHVYPVYNFSFETKVEYLAHFLMPANDTDEPKPV